ncbi:MAG: DMSO reductase [Burkholderiaceae bacterium]|nr:DMSO reductase [Burkholderiaceae bacterium]
MHPAFSLVFFTSMAGMAQGMVVSLLVLHLAGDPLPNQFMNYLAFPIILLLLAGGLLASFFHLGHPERAWRAILMWRTSWLSREVLVMPSFIALGFASGWFLLMVLFVIWSAWLSGEAIVTTQNIAGVAGFTAFLLLFSLTLKLWIWKRNRTLKPKSTLQSATGIQQTPVRQISMGMMGGSFNTREFFHQQSNFFIANVRKLAFFGAYIIPVTLLAVAVSQISLNLIVIAFMVHLLGLMAERWLFFAESNHPQNLYYQRIA